VIVRALRRGEQVHVVYLTKATSSVPTSGCAPGRGRRGRRVLGVGENSLIFLGYPDGSTADCATALFPRRMSSPHRMGFPHLCGTWPGSDGLSQLRLRRACCLQLAQCDPGRGERSQLASAGQDFRYLQFDAHPDHQSPTLPSSLPWRRQARAFRRTSPRYTPRLCILPSIGRVVPLTPGLRGQPGRTRPVFLRDPYARKYKLLWSDRDSLMCLWPCRRQPWTRI